MASVTVHNITDRPQTNVTPMAVRIGAEKIRPGRHAVVDDGVLKKQHRKLHGTYIWIGDLPPRLVRTSRAGLKVRDRDLSASGDPAMSIQEARGYLNDLGVEELLSLCSAIVPPLEFPNIPAQRVLVARLGRALFMSDRILDPEKFFWLRRWVKVGENFVERE